MSSSKKPQKMQDQSEEGPQGNVPAIMLQQAGAAASTAHNHEGQSAQERRHIGRDMPVSGHDDTLNADSNDSSVPPPAYGDVYGSITDEQEGYGTKASIGDDGRVNIRIDQRSKQLSSLLLPALRQQQEMANNEQPPPPPYIPPYMGGEEGVPPPPPMNIVIHVVGSRGDVQPFVALAKVLKDTYRHRVRLATHTVFKDFVEENGVEFFNIGGDPAQLMSFMVRNPGLMPGFDTLRNGDVGARRKEINEMLTGCWRSCFEAGNGMGQAATDTTVEQYAAEETDIAGGDPSNKPFVADAIIANPPSFAHIHCAEKLGIPLHVMFTMPYSPTQAFPHPLANIQSSNADPKLTNYITYTLVEMLTWQGLGDVINRFRTKSLGLDEISLIWAPGMLQRLRIPHTYCWSPALIPKPKDWGQQISISGFFFLNLATNYTPAPDLQAFLDAGPPPVYIGFGSIVLDDPNAMTKLIFEAVEKTGQRALVSKGWGGMGADDLGKPDNVFMLGNVPHDWLFKHVSCVVHHGGAGTTAAGITAGKPTVVVPFFGDQQFWGSMVARAGAGPDPLPNKQLTADKLADAINFCLKEETQGRAHELAAKIAKERGSDTGAQSFHQLLDVDTQRCALAPSRTAVWRVKRTQVRLSAMAACTLASEGLLDFNELKLFRPREYETDEGAWEPITGGATALIGTMSTMMMGVADFPIDTLKALKIHPDATKKKPVNTDGTSESSAGDASKTSSEGTVGQSTRASTMSGSTIGSGATTPGTSTPSSGFNLEESLSKIKTPTSPLISPVSELGRTSSMADALRERFDDSRSKSRTTSSQDSGASAPPKAPKDTKQMIETALGTTRGVQKIVGAGFKSPMDFTMGLAKGFHNAPKLYGDETVRKAEPVTDFKSGIRAATKEFGFGFYDGITGLMTQPIKGAEKDGAAGFIKGIGKGIGGLVFKPGAAIWGIPGYTMKGVYKEMQKQMGSSVQNYIIAARTAQGFDEWSRALPQEREDVVRRWQSMQHDLKKKKNPDEIVKEILAEHVMKRREWFDHRQNQKGEKSRSRATSSSGKEKRRSRGLSLFGKSGVNAPASDAELEEAIRQSVQQTSNGNPEEDAAIERAIRASMTELARDRGEGHEEDDESAALRKAMEASMADTGRPKEERDEELERALANSLREQRQGGKQPALHSSQDAGPSDTLTLSHPPSYDDGDQGHMAGTTRDEYEQQSRQSGGGEKTQQERSEEEVVMEYVKKQSMLEQQHRKQTTANSGSGEGSSRGGGEDEDEELKRAIERSRREA